jgi:hypothetical protein
MNNTFQDLNAGDTVRFRMPNGIGRNGPEYKAAKGTVIKYLVFQDHVCVNVGRGNPQVVDSRNFISVVRRVA